MLAASKSPLMVQTLSQMGANGALKNKDGLTYKEILAKNTDASATMMAQASTDEL